jgi:hypothetical protein
MNRRAQTGGGRVPGTPGAVGPAPAESAAGDQAAAKNRALEQLADNMRLDLTYAELTAKDAPDQLAKLGWGPRRDPGSLEIPGVVRDLSIKSQGEGWLVLD